MGIIKFRQEVSIAKLTLGSRSTTANYIFVRTDGHDTDGDGTDMNPYLTITQAMSVATATRNRIIVYPGTYTEATTVTWPTVSGIQLLGLSGQWDTTIATAAGDEVITVAPGAQSSTFEMTMENIYIDHDSTGLDGITFSNASMTKKLNVYLKDVGMAADSDTDKSINVKTHTDTGNAIRIYWSGKNGDVDGQVFFETDNDGDRLYITGVRLLGGIVVGTNTGPLRIELKDCVVKHEGVTGGTSSTVAVAMSCFSLTGTTYAALDGNDIAGSITGELILP